MLSNYLAQHGVGRVASGGSPPRFYLHAETSGGNGARLLLEVVIVPAASAAAVTLKAQDATVIAAFQTLLADFLVHFQG